MKYLACENDFHQFLRTHRSHSSETCCVKHYIHQCFSTNNFIKDCQQVMNESVCEKIDKFDSRCTEEIIRQCPNRIVPVLVSEQFFKSRFLLISLVLFGILFVSSYMICIGCRTAHQSKEIITLDYEIDYRNQNEEKQSKHRLHLHQSSSYKMFKPK